MALPDDVRAHCAEVAARATHVRIVHEAIAGYARTLPDAPAPRPPVTDSVEVAFSLQLNAVNFGSGWFPTLRKPPGLSGFRTVEAGLKRNGPFARDELRAMTPHRIAEVLGQDPGHELMGLFARALRELGELDGAPDGDAVEVAERLAELPMWRDPGFYKRAQIAAADLGRPGVERLTIFADNLVPHVLRIDGVLEFEPRLVERIEREELLLHGSAEEVEIRACAVHAVELMVAAHGATHAAAADYELWTRGAQARYKARPRHRARTTAY